ncbi:MAG: ribulose-phosphate 3-epimerase [Dorea sp.]|jgi:ribulose-phosphate 3-epimerase|nr:ribulose-phosphate 3-epimerase [Dorea sp.]
MKYVIAPSILSADFTRLGSEIKQTEENGAAFLHFDVMDGMFVPNISFGIPVMKSIRKATGQIMDAHLMVQDPIRYLEAFRDAGADLITVHYEACPDVTKALVKIKDMGLKAGLSINPDTPVEAVREYLEIVDMVLVMSVYPGQGGQKFIRESLDRIRDIRRMITETDRDIDLQVDGGVTLDNLREIMDAGANIFVAGSAVFGGDIGGNVRRCMEIFREYE